MYTVRLIGATASRTKERLRPYYLRWLYFRLFPHARPAEFSNCWDFPCFPLEPENLRAQVTADCSPSFLFYPMTDLHARMQRTQHLAMALAERGHACFLLNPHLGRQFRTVFFQDADSRFGLLNPRLAELHIRLQDEPVYHRRLLDAAESLRIADEIAPLNKFAGARVQQVLSLPTWLDAALVLRSRFGWPIVYDCHDLLSGFRGISSDIVHAEQRALDEADLVLFSSQELMDHHVAEDPSLAAKSATLKNAVNPGHFSGIASHRHTRGGQGGVIGYFGALDEWFDVDAVTAVAQAFPERKIQLIGRVEHEGIWRLARLSNVELLGEIPYERLPEFVAHFDAGLIPFRITPLTRATNPIKLYEYFSCGLPVVTTRLPEVELFESLVYIADGATCFPAALHRALDESDPQKTAARMEIANRETWDARAAALAGSVLGENLVRTIHAGRLRSASRSL